MSEKEILLSFEGKLCGRYLNKQQRVLKREGGPAPMWHASSASNEAVYPERGCGYHCEKAPQGENGRTKTSKLAQVQEQWRAATLGNLGFPVLFTILIQSSELLSRLLQHPHTDMQLEAERESQFGIWNCACSSSAMMLILMA